MTNLQNEKVLITGGSKGLGRAIINALVAHGAKVTAISRNKSLLNEMVAENISVIPGDATDKIFIDKIVSELRPKPTLLILNAGATPFMAPIDEQTWKSFSTAWNTDVKAVLHGIQAVLKTPMPKGSRVLIVSSGAALGGSPLSGGYAGAKRMLWFMAKYANEISIDRSLAIHFQVIVPMQIFGDTDLGLKAASAYAKRKNMSIENYLTTSFDHPLSATGYAEYVIKLLTNKTYTNGIAYGIKRDGITKLE